MCHALRVLCVAPDAGSLAALMRASVSAEWELARGATTAEEALARIAEASPHVLVVSGPFEDLVAAVGERFPGLRVVADRPMPGAHAVVAGHEELREAVRGLPGPGGPVRRASRSARSEPSADPSVR